MIFTLRIKRRGKAEKKSYWQNFRYEDDGASSVAAALEHINCQSPLFDADGKTAAPVAWERGCLSRKCGACAMLINGLPRLACSSFLGDVKKKNNTITLEPLSKFPVVEDLIADRSAIFESLKTMRFWLAEEADASAWNHEARFASARCMLCGCCLEVCPNFKTGGLFAGAAGAVNAYRIFDETRRGEHRGELENQYKARFFEDCGASLACAKICPLGLPVEDLIARSNAAAVWRKFGA